MPTGAGEHQRRDNMQGQSVVVYGSGERWVDVTAAGYAEGKLMVAGQCKVRVSPDVSKISLNGSN
jgi:hypothetical protein